LFFGEASLLDEINEEVVVEDGGDLIKPLKGN
jgi:hypothetical protein